jgi:hypothetical protein
MCIKLSYVSYVYTILMMEGHPDWIVGSAPGIHYLSLLV